MMIDLSASTKKSANSSNFGCKNVIEIKKFIQREGFAFLFWLKQRKVALPKTLSPLVNRVSSHLAKVEK